MTAPLTYLIPWGYTVLLGLEGWRSPLLDNFFLFITEFGAEKFYIVLIAVMFWSISKPIARKLSFIYLTSSVVNLYLKTIFAIPRPADPLNDEILSQNGIISRLDPLADEMSGSFPSNHAQGSTVSWGYMACAFGKRWLLFLSIVMIVLIGFSRMYIGVHYPQDVLAGWLIGLVYLVVWLKLEKPVMLLRDRIPWLVQLAVVVLVPFGLCLIAPVPEVDKVLGAIAGLGAGYILEAVYVKFSEHGRVPVRILRSIVGLMLVFSVQIASKKILAYTSQALPEHWEALVVSLMYMLTGFVAVFIVPWLFTIIKLAHRDV